MRWILTLLVLLATAPAALAQEQSVRVVAPDATVRIAPSADATVATTPAVGSLLEIANAEGDWYVVLLPPDSQGIRRYGYILRRSVEIVGVAADRESKATIGLRLPGEDDPSIRPVPLAPDWQTRFRAAESRRAGGHAKWFGGLATIVGGAAVLSTVLFKMADSRGPTGECSHLNPCYEYAWATGGGIGMLVTGRILMSRGRRQIADAERQIIQLKTEAANAKPSGEHH